jgi:signal recognition particle GTPase
MDDKVLVRMEAIINSMTMKERAKPEIIKGSRKRRIAAGCGMQVQDVNRLLKQFDDMQRMMKKMKKGGMAKMMRGMKGMMPPGFLINISATLFAILTPSVLEMLTYCVYAPLSARTPTPNWLQR